MRSLSSAQHSWYHGSGSEGQCDFDIWRCAGDDVAESDDYLCYKDCYGGADAKTLGVRVEADHPVEDEVEHDRGDEEEGQFGELLGDEVEADAVHIVLLLAQEDGDLGAEDVCHGHHVDKGEGNQAHEEHRVDILHICLL